MDATMTAAQERVEDDQLVVDPAQWPNPEHQQLERIAAYKKGNTHSNYWKNAENGNLCLYILAEAWRDRHALLLQEETQ